MFPGILSWWLNYNLVASRAFLVKLSMAIVTLLLGLVAIWQQVVFPEVAWDLGIEGLVYHAAAISFTVGTMQLMPTTAVKSHLVLTTQTAYNHNPIDFFR